LKKILLIIPFLLFVSLPVKADDGDTWIPQSQIDLCESLGAEYGICPELLEAIIENESSGKMEATNGSCYGICQINGAVWGYGYDTEEKQIRKACEMLIGFDCEVDEALARYQGQRNPKYEGYVEKVLTRSHELEVLHYGN
jgi:hypothetical protein